jgi:hypothetical protein
LKTLRKTIRVLPVEHDVIEFFKLDFNGNILNICHEMGCYLLELEEKNFFKTEFFNKNKKINAFLSNEIKLESSGYKEDKEVLKNFLKFESGVTFFPKKLSEEIDLIKLTLKNQGNVTDVIFLRLIV